MKMGKCAAYGDSNLTKLLPAKPGLILGQKAFVEGHVHALKDQALLRAVNRVAAQLNEIRMFNSS